MLLGGLLVPRRIKFLNPWFGVFFLALSKNWVLPEDYCQKGLEVCYCLWGLPSRPSTGSDPGPIQVPSWVRRGPVQIRHMLCFTVFRTHPGPKVGAILARPGPMNGPKQTSWPLPILQEKTPETSTRKCSCQKLATHVQLLANF